MKKVLELSDNEVYLLRIWAENMKHLAPKHNFRKSKVFNQLYDKINILSYSLIDSENINNNVGIFKREYECQWTKNDDEYDTSIVGGD